MLSLERQRQSFVIDIFPGQSVCGMKVGGGHFHPLLHSGVIWSLMSEGVGFYSPPSTQEASENFVESSAMFRDIVSRPEIGPGCAQIRFRGWEFWDPQASLHTIPMGTLGTWKLESFHQAYLIAWACSPEFLILVSGARRVGKSTYSYEGAEK